VQAKLYEIMKTVAEDVGFQGGAAAIMDVESGELLALISYPEYNLTVLSNGEPKEEIDAMLADEQKPFLNRPVTGLYAPGSIIKPFIAVGALEENIISPYETINSTGALVIPNPYFPDQPSVFRDWKAHGLVDMRHAISVSSDQYFYIVGGGLPDQPPLEEREGLGIRRIDEYLRLFGFTTPTGIVFEGEPAGTIPTPEWKKETFGEEWLLGNTYHTAIGQYGFQTTVLQALRAVSAIANGGKLVTPQVVKGVRGESETVPVSSENLQIVREGMRLSATEGTGQGLNVSYVSIAAKTGTAELGAAKDFVNSWVTGFFPYEKPHYAFVVMMEKGPATNLIGGVSIMRQLLDWMRDNAPQYFESTA
jgi:penicillin-binding protein 2